MAQASHLDPVQLLADLVRFPSLSHEEKDIADFVERFVGERGVSVARHGDNVYFWIGEGQDVLLLNSHLDVVPPSANHPYDPFDPVIKDGLMFGRGSVDAKASGAAMTTALLNLAATGWTPADGKVMVALTTCEETGGGYNGLQELRPHLPRLGGALVGEPTDLQPCLAQKGLLILKVTAMGRTAHAARAHLGVNAIVRAAEDIRRLNDYRFTREDELLGLPTLTVTTIEGGTARNVVPDRCTFYVDVRTTPEYDHDSLTDELAGRVESNVEIHSKRIIPVATPRDSRIERACLAALPDAEPFGSPTASDWIFLHDVPAIKIGPGSSELSHTPDEHINIEEVRRAVDVYTRIIRSFFEDQESETESN